MPLSHQLNLLNTIYRMETVQASDVSSLAGGEEKVVVVERQWAAQIVALVRTVSEWKMVDD